MAIKLQPSALGRLDEIYLYTRDMWGAEQAKAYSDGLFALMDGLETGATPSRAIPVEVGVQGFYFRYRRHIVYWQRLSNGDIGIVSVLHERMHQADRLRDDLTQP